MNKTQLTDLYQLTMLAGYFDNQKDETATFELFIRNLPKDWGYFIASGINEAIDYATSIKFEKEDLEYLSSQNLFNQSFIEHLKDFRFTGDIYSVREGTPITANMPLMRITAKRSEAQFLETTLLNIINFQTMIASKASRIVNTASPSKVVDFGLRRAQGEDAALKGARACYIAGCAATSNVLAGQLYKIPISGTMAHSFVMSFPTELEAFQSYTKTFPNNATLLIDTYNTIEGAKNAVIAAKELEKQNKKLVAVRIDSGNLAESTKAVRNILDQNNLQYVKIFVSNDLNEYKIQALKQANAPIDGYGVGTEMITAKPIAAISGVYKLVEDNAGPKIKLSNAKRTYPGAKQVYRISDENGNYYHDVLALESEVLEGKPLLEKVIEHGKRISEAQSLGQIRKYSLEEIAKLPAHAKQLIANPLELRTSEALDTLVENLSEKYGNKKQ